MAGGSSRFHSATARSGVSACTVGGGASISCERRSTYSSLRWRMCQWPLTGITPNSV